MVKFSYYGNKKLEHLPSSPSFVSISRINPSWFPYPLISDLSLAPTKELLNLYKNKQISIIEFSKRYTDEVLSFLDPHEIAKKYKDRILLCYECPHDFCHRQIIAKWLEDYGYETKEIESTAKKKQPTLF